jgi:hypothetical protein
VRPAISHPDAPALFERERDRVYDPPSACRGDLLTDEQILESFRGMLPELDELETLVETMYAQADRVPARTPLVRLDRDWIADIEAELRG